MRAVCMEPEQPEGEDVEIGIAEVLAPVRYVPVLRRRDRDGFLFYRRTCNKTSRHSRGISQQAACRVVLHAPGAFGAANLVGDSLLYFLVGEPPGKAKIDLRDGDGRRPNIM